MELFVETHVLSPKGDAAVRGQLCLVFCGMFDQSNYFISYYFLELNMLIF